MVKQRFLTHFKPWLVAVIKVTGTDRCVSTLRSGPHVFRICVSEHRECGLRGDSSPARDRAGLHDHGMGRVVLVQTAQASLVL